MCAHGEDLCRVEGDALAEQLKLTAFHVAEFDGRKEGGATLASRRAPRNTLRFKRTMPVLWAPRRYSVTPAGRCLETEAHVVAAAVFTPVERVLRYFPKRAYFAVRLAFFVERRDDDRPPLRDCLPWVLAP